MQDKESVAAEEAAKTEPLRESAKDGGKSFAFKKMKSEKAAKPSKKEKADKNSLAKYEGDGVVFKAKLIGVESVPDARGDNMCQEAMTRLKLNVRNTGPHKRKINISVSLQGIKVKDEKTGAVIHHHPVSIISFISQDITDARAFGYVFGSTSEPHQFIAIKTEKPAFHVVLALRDLFQTVLNRKQEGIQNVKETSEVENKEDKSKDPEMLKTVSNTTEESKPEEAHIYFEVLLTEPLQMVEEPEVKAEPIKTVDDLLDLEMSKLQEGINQMDTSIAAAAAFNAEIPLPEMDPFDTSFVLGPKRDSFPMPIPTPFPVAPTPASETSQFQNLSTSGDKYAVFNAIDGSPSIFEAPELGPDAVVSDVKDLEEEIAQKSVPPKPPRLSKSASPDLSVFADLDPLGKDRPYKDKTEFFQDVKNPPKKVLNDLVDPSKEASKVFDVNILSSSVPFPVDFESMTPPLLNSVTSNGHPTNTQTHLNGKSEKNHNPFDNRNLSNRSESSPSPPNAILSQSLTVNCNNSNLTSSPFYVPQNTSSPIPIPTKHVDIIKDRTFSSDSIGSPYSKSPMAYNPESPNNSDYYISLYNSSEGYSPYTNGDNGNNISPNNLTKQNLNSFLNSTTQNGVSRPRPRPNSKAGSMPNGGRTTSSHSLSSDSSSDYEAISRESMQSIANVLLTNGHRLRAQSLCMDNEFKLKQPISRENIFAKKNDPFADDFFFSVPKKNGHLTSAEIPEYV
ncbi:hypothetical protein JTE90_029303 [Oedothorax gibbosus]|uniref:PID domain-containing protein n=1 Tax=Oedothorax gibbosus TaxID=931172 RepID=A0AAV6TZ68_9ARAC|nr:hypothetical protein JTE90_029303 [Oedothorax gibbosus]